MVGVAVFVGIGLLGLSAAFRGAQGCAPALQWEDRAYHATGTPAPSPDLGEGDAVRIGSTFMGPITRAVYGPPGSSPSTDAADRPASIALDCGDGTFQAYQWDGISLTPAPLPTEGP